MLLSASFSVRGGKQKYASCRSSGVLVLHPPRGHSFHTSGSGDRDWDGRRWNLDVKSAVEGHWDYRLKLKIIIIH